MFSDYEHNLEMYVYPIIYLIFPHVQMSFLHLKYLLLVINPIGFYIRINCCKLDFTVFAQDFTGVTAS